MHALEAGSKGNLSRADLATWAGLMLLSQGAFVTAAAMFNVAGGGGRDGRRSIIDDAGHRVVAQEGTRKTNTGAEGSGPSELTHWVVAQN